MAVGAFFLALALISPRGMGLGDVKLAPTLGLALGWLSWGAVAFGVFAGFLLGGLAGLAAIGLLGLTRKSLLPFGPWLVTGALLGVLAGADVAAWYAAQPARRLNRVLAGRSRLDGRRSRAQATVATRGRAWAEIQKPVRAAACGAVPLASARCCAISPPGSPTGRRWSPCSRGCPRACP